MPTYTPSQSYFDPNTQTSSSTNHHPHSLSSNSTTSKTPTNAHNNNLIMENINNNIHTTNNITPNTFSNISTATTTPSSFGITNYMNNNLMSSSLSTAASPVGLSTSTTTSPFPTASDISLSNFTYNQSTYPTTSNSGIAYTGRNPTYAQTLQQSLSNTPANPSFLGAISSGNHLNHQNGHNHLTKNATLAPLPSVALGNHIQNNSIQPPLPPPQHSHHALFSHLLSSSFSTNNNNASLSISKLEKDEMKSYSQEDESQDNPTTKDDNEDDDNEEDKDGSDFSVGSPMDEEDQDEDMNLNFDGVELDQSDDVIEINDNDSDSDNDSVEKIAPSSSSRRHTGRFSLKKEQMESIQVDEDRSSVEDKDDEIDALFEGHDDEDADFNPLSTSKIKLSMEEEEEEKREIILMDNLQQDNLDTTPNSTPIHDLFALPTSDSLNNTTSTTLNENPNITPTPSSTDTSKSNNNPITSITPISNPVSISNTSIGNTEKEISSISTQEPSKPKKKKKKKKKRNNPSDKWNSSSFVSLISTSDKAKSSASNDHSQPLSDSIVEHVNTTTATAISTTSTTSNSPKKSASKKPKKSKKRKLSINVDSLLGLSKKSSDSNSIPSSVLPTWISPLPSTHQFTTLSSPSSTIPTLTSNPSHAPIDSMSTTTNGSILVSLPEDTSYLTELHCHVRQNLEFFSMTQHDIDLAATRRRRGGPLFLGKVGLRCIHCRQVSERILSPPSSPYPNPQNSLSMMISPVMQKQPQSLTKHGQIDKRRGPGGYSSGSISYPPDIAAIYTQCTQKPNLHFSKCPNLPPLLREQFMRLMYDEFGKPLRQKQASPSLAMKYCKDAARRLGLMDCKDGIRFAEREENLRKNPLPMSSAIQMELKTVENLKNSTMKANPSVSSWNASFQKPSPIPMAQSTITTRGVQMKQVKKETPISTVPSSVTTTKVLNPASTIAADNKMIPKSKPIIPKSFPNFIPNAPKCFDSLAYYKEDPRTQKVIQVSYSTPIQKHSSVFSPFVMVHHRSLITDYVYFILAQLTICRVESSDFHRGKRSRSLQLGMAGLCCKYCAVVSSPNPGRSFPTTPDNIISGTNVSYYNHLTKCFFVPSDIKHAIQASKKHHSNQMSSLPHGSQRMFAQMFFKIIRDNDAISTTTATDTTIKGSGDIISAHPAVPTNLSSKQVMTKPDVPKGIMNGLPSISKETDLSSSMSSPLNSSLPISNLLPPQHLPTQSTQSNGIISVNNFQTQINPLNTQTSLNHENRIPTANPTIDISPPITNSALNATTAATATATATATAPSTAPSTSTATATATSTSTPNAITKDTISAPPSNIPPTFHSYSKISPASLDKLKRYAFHQTSSGWWICKHCKKVPLDLRAKGSLFPSQPTETEIRSHRFICKEDSFDMETVVKTVQSMIHSNIGMTVDLLDHPLFKCIVRELVGGKKDLCDLFTSGIKSKLLNKSYQFETNSTMWRLFPFTVDKDAIFHALRTFQNASTGMSNDFVTNEHFCKFVGFLAPVVCDRDVLEELDKRLKETASLVVEETSMFDI